MDTGSAKNIICKKYIDKMTAPQKATTLRTAGGYGVSVIGETIEKIKIARKWFSVKFLVIENLPRPMILGTEFLSEHGVIIDFKNSIISMNDGNQRLNIPLKRHQETVCFTMTNDETKNNPQLKKFTLRKDIRLKENEIMRLPINKKTDEIFIPNDKFALKKGLIISAENKNLVIHYKRAAPLRLFKGTTLGYWEPIPEIRDNLMLYVEEEDDVTAADHHISTRLTTTQQAQIATLLSEYKHVFAKSVRKMGFTKIAEHEIDV